MLISLNNVFSINKEYQEYASVLKSISDIENKELITQNIYNLKDIHENEAYHLLTFKNGGYTIVAKDSKVISKYNVSERTTNPFFDFLISVVSANYLVSNN